MENEYLTLKNTCPVTVGTSEDKERDLAILFLDIRNFTGLMESQPGQAVIQVVRRLFVRFNQIIQKFQGKVVEIAGDNLYAVFGLQADLRDATNNAYQAAKVMFQTVSLFNEAYVFPDYGDPLEIGVGLHTGKVFVGEFGLDNRPQMTVMGLPVNIASRLQAKTKEINNDMLISEDVYRLLELEDRTFDQRILNLQGISQRQQVRLAGKPYSNRQYLSASEPSLAYLIAVSG